MSHSTTGTEERVGELPRPLVFDPGGGGEPPIEAGTETVVLLLAGEGEREWAAKTAMQLSGAWARDGRRIVLADLNFEDPVLHELVGNSNLEGVVDVFLYGASVARSARPVRGYDFYLLPAGTYEPDAEAIYRHPRWAKLVAGFRDASATLVLFAPVETSDPAAIADWLDRVILLGDEGGAETLGALSARGLVPDARLVPRGRGSAEPPRAEPSGMLRAEAAPDLMIPPAPVRPAPHRGRRVLIALTLVLAALAVAAAGFLLARTRPDLVPWARGAAPPPAAVEIAQPATGASRVGDPLPYSVQVKAFTSLAAARDQIQDEQNRLAGVPFFISPEEIQGVLYFKILAGLAPDTVTATRLRERLIASGALEDDAAVGSWTLIQYAPLAFDVGELAGAAAASARRDSLAAVEVSSYAVPIPYSDGSRRWQLYAGAYRDSASAEAMRQRLVAAGIQPRLVPRIGERTASTR